MASFDNDFFELVLTYKSLTDETYLASIVDYIKPIYFKNRDIASIFTVIKDFYERRQCCPTVTEVKTFLTTEELKNSFKSVVLQFKDLDKSFNKEELLANTEQFIKEKAVYYAMLDTINDVNKKEVDTGLILEKFEKACNISLALDSGFNFFEGVDKLITSLTENDRFISSGWKWLDEKLGGGFLEEGRAVYIFAGQTNIGKSIFLGNIVTNIARQNKTVLLISLEMSEMMYAKRIASDITKIPLSDLKHNTDSLKTRINDAKEANPNGRILIKEFPPSTITANHIKAFIKKIEDSGVAIDALVLDYVNLLSSPVGDNSYERIKHATEQIRALSYVFSFPVITATQLAKAGYNTPEPGIETVSESSGLGHTADAMMAIWQEDCDRELGVIKLGMMKNRFGANFGYTALRVDYNTLTLSEDDAINKTVAGIASSDALAAFSIQN